MDREGFVAWAALGLALACGGVHAQDAAKRPIRLLVPSPAGGPSDFAARLIQTRLSEALQRTIVIDNRQSVNGILASEIAAKSPADGSTLLIGNNGTLVMNPGLYKKLPYDPLRDFAPITQLVSAGTALVASTRFPPQTFKDFVAAARKEPGRINIGVAGANGAVGTEVLKLAAGIKLNNIPYKGSAPTEQAIVGGEIDVALLSVPVVAPQVKAGKMKIYGVTNARRSPMMPDVPTIREQGVEGYEFGNWHGLLAPAGTSDRIIRDVHRETVKILHSKDIADVVAHRGNEVIANTPEEFAAKLKREIPRYKKIIAESGIEIQ
ncbi:MAG TPA: tripartite tricarboxylate transporter substrate binding protein [Burkholderiales bacterium]|nr:tripartite tricarboxylate transporter substrate binding protein [Burkholderiales bacterium]